MVFKTVSILLFLLISADAAYAGPVGAAVAAVGSFFATGIGSMVGRVVIGLGLSLLQKALTGKNKTAAAGQVLEIKMGEDQPMSFIIGSRAVGGRRKYIGTWGSDGSTPNAFLTDVIELSNLPSYAGPQGLNSVWIDDKKCTVDWSRPHADGRGYPITEFRKNGKDYLWLKYYDGTQTAADSFLVAKFGGNADRPYASDRIGRGVQYIILTARYNTDLFSGMPTGIYEPKPTPFYDPRRDSTNGGSGTHRWNDPSTYEPTLNPITAAYNIARGIYYDGDWFYGGQNVSAHRLPNASWFAAANECDRTVNDAAQFRCGLEVTLDTEPLDVLEDLRIACAGRFAEVGGFIKPLVGAPGSAVYSFDDDGIVVSKDQDFEPFPSLKSTHNRVAGTYPEPEEKWATKDAPESRNLTLEAEDGNRSLPVSVSFAAVPYSAQVQSLIETMVKEQRRFRTHVVTLPPLAAALEPNDVVAWTSERNAYANKKFLVTANNGQSGMLRQVSLTEIDPSDYDPPETIVAPVIGWTGPVTAPVQAMTGFQVEAGSVTDADSQQRRPAIVVSCASDLDDVARVWIKIRVKATGIVVLDTDALPYGAPARWTLSGTWCLALTEYEVQGKLVPVTARETDWSAWIDVTTLNLSESSDVLDGSIVTSKLADAAVTAAKIMDEAITSLKLADDAVTTAKLAVAAVTSEILAAGAVTAAKLADAAVTATALAAGVVDATKLAASIEAVKVVTALPTSRVAAYVTYNGVSYRWNGSAYVNSVATSELTGQIISSQVADAAIQAAKLADSAVTTVKIAANAVTADQVAAGAITAKHLVLTDFTNLVPDNQMQDPGNSWSGAGWSSWSDAYLGGMASKSQMVYTYVAGQTGYSAALISRMFPVVAGAQYRVTGSSYSNGKQAPLLRIHWFTVTGAEISFSAILDVSGGSTSSYLTATVNVTAPAGAVYGRIQAYVQRSNINNHVYVGGFVVNRRNAAELIVDGSITANALTAGAVTSDKIAANAVTTAAIAAGAVSADQIAAGAITTDKIGAGAVTTGKLAVGTGANWFVNSDCQAGKTYWLLAGTSGGTWEFSVRTTDNWAPPGGAFQIVQTDASTASYYADLVQCDANGATKYWDVVAGNWYEVSCYSYGHRGSGFSAYLVFTKADGTWVSAGQLWGVGAAQNGDPQNSLASYLRPWAKAQAPAGAVKAYVIFRAQGSATAGVINSFLWLTRMYFGEATANQSQPSAWQPAGATLINGGSIVASAITTDLLAANAVTAAKLAAGSVTADKIVAGSVTADKIAASSITGDKIAANTIGANNIAANAVTAKQLVLTDFTNLVPDNQMQDPGNSWSGSGWSSWTDAYLGGMASKSQMRFIYAAGSGYTDGLISRLFPVTANAQYRVTGSAYSNGTQAPLLRIIWYNSAGAQLSYIDFGNWVGGTGSGIVTATMNVTAPAGATQARVAAYVYLPNTNSDVYVGGFVVNKRNAADLIVDGAITANQLSVNSLSAITANLGTVTAGVIQASNGKMVINLGAGSMEWYE
ncbi:phage tail protein [Rhizobium paknamense]|uniref:Tip attachment protein J domain-containing protein n=1 Tax=Rhizobium paknamense TaxID=1206817 RepID=A0ABU0I8X5_9HYPH|nr:phage tail protein [Rhizobium paknamense]MDQ0454662.1 hypothetical protein [Rhizobium paknamense]